MKEPKMEVLSPAGAAELFPLEDETINDALTLIDENLGGQLDTLNLMRIKVPTGAAPSLVVETANGEEMRTHQDVILLASRKTRRYFVKAFGTGPKKPPQCVSTDGFRGVGDPGGVCRQCPYARFGSAVRSDGSPGPGQACKAVIQVLVLLPGEILPHLLQVPPTSLKTWDHYMVTLVTGRMRFWGCITRLALEKTGADTGMPYSRLTFRMQGKLEPVMINMLDPYRLRMRDLLVPSVIDVSDYEIPEEAEPEAPKRARFDNADGGANPDEIPF
jgi:hypothetical protein